MFLCSALEQKFLFLLKIHKWLGKTVVNQTDEEEDTINK